MIISDENPYDNQDNHFHFSEGNLI